MAQKQSTSIKIPPYHYIHVLDRNTNVTRVELGPQTFIRQDHEQATSGNNPLKMIIIPKRHYCEIENPIIMDKDGNPKKDKHGQFQVLLGEVEIRFHDDYQFPFPLYPREVIRREPTKLTVVKEMSALRLEATRNFKNSDGQEVTAGEEYLFIGPATYYPRVEERIIAEVKSWIIAPFSALRLRAKEQLVDAEGQKRKTGEEWLIRKTGAYLPKVQEEVIQLCDPYILDNTKSLHLRANRTFTDVYGIERKAGEEYLITNERSSFHVQDIYEEVIAEVKLTILSSLQYCIILNPFDEDIQKNRLGAKVQLTGPRSFFLKPGEELEGGIKDCYILSEDQALLVRAKEKFSSKERVRLENGNFELLDREYEPGNRWMIYGPCNYIPPVQVEIIEQRPTIPLDKNEGIYIRDTRTGKVDVHMGSAYMLKSHEELWDMELPDGVETLLKPSYFHTNYIRIKHKVVSFRAPFNSAVQVYDYKAMKSRIVFGPDLVTLRPDEAFTQLSLSGKTPKKPGMVNTLHLVLGPEFSTDEIQVETSDHAVLKLLLAYNWQFKVDKNNQTEAAKIFNVKDFIGDLCNLMASKVRAAVASADFDTFHKTSARLIRKSIFGMNEQGKIGKEFMMDKNNLMVTNVDIKAVEPVDVQTKLSLQKTVQLAIEISTKKQEAAATHLANQSEQKALGEIEELKIQDQLKAEQAQQKLLQLQAKSKEVETQGQTRAVEEALAKAEQIIAETKLEVAKNKAHAMKIESDALLAIKVKEENIIDTHKASLIELEINKAKELAEIESKKFEEMIDAIGSETIVSISNAGPETQAQLLKGLGLQGYIFTDGNNPINLFNSAQGLVGGLQQQTQQ